jgi:serine/threonine protein kinase
VPVPRDAERNLLFGLLALQNNFIDREALLDGFNRWVAENKARALGQILVDRGALGSDEQLLLEALVAKHLLKFGDDPQKSLQALSSIGSLREELSQIGEPDLNASLVQVAATHHEEDPHRTVGHSSLGTSTSAGSRFRILRPHAKGGLGQISVALDQELDRPVALKEIQDRHADDLFSRARFVQEAEITGKLQHPGIIPVYGLGHDASGRPFYAMRFIHGDSLSEAITAFHCDQALKRDSVARCTRLRELLRRFTDVCNAIAYAHSRGVLHRDLKPGNIMLGPFGETLLVDWGLAKLLEPATSSKPAPEIREPSLPIEGTVHLSGLSGQRADTVAGSLVGTPAYASPEQVSGRLDLLGPASDVYGLGATLYALLTGRPPVESTDLETVLRQVRRGEIPPPRSVEPAIPRALEAICQKAMALEPADRYPSARALAADVTRWLDDAPVSAYVEPVSVRAGRWIRRHQRLVSSAVAAAMVGLVAMAIAYSRESRINHKLDQTITQLKIARVKDQMSNILDQFQGSDQDVDRFAVRLEELARLDRGKVAQQKQALGDHLVQAVGRMVHQERSLSGVDIDRIRSVLRRVSEYAPQAVAPLEAALGERLTRLDPVFTLAAPFEGLAGVFEPGQVEVSERGLVAADRSPGERERLIPSKVACQGDVEIEGMFSLIPEPGAGKRYGVALGAGPGRGYTFTLSPRPAQGTEPSSKDAQAGRPTTMTLERNGVVLRQAEVMVKGPTVRVFAQTRGDHLSFTIDRTELGFDDIFPLFAASPGVFGVVLSNGVRLDQLVARKQQLPRSPSPLEKGDAFYGRGMVAEALEEFNRVQDTAEQADLKAEARYKRALCLVALHREGEARPVFEQLAIDPGRWQIRSACQVWKILLRSAKSTDIERADQIFDFLNANVEYADLALVLSESERDEILAYYRQVGYYPRINWTSVRVRNLERALKIEELIKADRVTRLRTHWRLADA